MNRRRGRRKPRLRFFPATGTSLERTASESLFVADSGSVHPRDGVAGDVRTTKSRIGNAAWAGSAVVDGKGCVPKRGIAGRVSNAQSRIVRARGRQEPEGEVNGAATNRWSSRIPGSFYRDAVVRDIRGAISRAGAGAAEAGRGDGVRISGPKRDGRRSRAFRSVVKQSSLGGAGSAASSFTVRAKRERVGDESR